MKIPICTIAKIVGITALALAVTGCHHARHREAWGLVGGALAGGVIGDMACQGDSFCTTTGAIVGGAAGYAAGRHSGARSHHGSGGYGRGNYGQGYYGQPPGYRGYGNGRYGGYRR